MSPTIGYIYVYMYLKADKYLLAVLVTISVNESKPEGCSYNESQNEYETLLNTGGTKRTLHFPYCVCIVLVAGN